MVVLIVGLGADEELTLRQGRADGAEDRVQQRDLVDADLEVEDRVDVGGAVRAVSKKNVSEILATLQDVIAKAAMEIVVSGAAVDMIITLAAKKAGDIICQRIR